MTIEAVLRRVPALQGADERTLARLAAAHSVRSLQRGQALWYAGAPARSFTVIARGLVKMSKPGNDGRRTICGLFGPPESLGDVVFLNGGHYPADAVVVSESASIVSLPRDTFQACLSDCPKLGVSIACGMAEKLRALHGSIDVLSAGSVESRLATALLDLYERVGDELHDGTLLIPVSLSRRELAEMVSTSMETAIRVMARWERQGVVKTSSDGFTLLDERALRCASGVVSVERETGSLCGEPLLLEAASREQ